MKVLQLIDGKSYGGICKLLEDVEKNISSDISFTYLTANNISPRYINLSVDRKKIGGKVQYLFRLNKYLKKNIFDIVHINSGAFFYVFTAAIICRLSGVKHIIVHSHNTPYIKLYKRIIIKILNPLLSVLTSAKLSCSSSAIRSLYSNNKNVIVLKNGVDVNKYKYNLKYRHEIRRIFKIDESSTIYIHVGRFEMQKNHDFLIKLFNEIQKDSDAILMLVGEGTLKENIIDMVNSFHIQNKVKFLGFRNDVEKLLSAADVFLLPSLYEGMPVVAVESLASGLPTFVSSNITDDINIFPNCYKLNTFNINEWLKKLNLCPKINRKAMYKYIINSGFSIEDTAKKLEDIYRGVLK